MAKLYKLVMQIQFENYEVLFYFIFTNFFSLLCGMWRFLGNGRVR